MTVGTSNDAFLNFSDQRNERDGVENELGHGFSLFAEDVIELEDGDVGFSAIDARMR